MLSRRHLLRSGLALSAASLAARSPIAHAEALLGGSLDTPSPEALAAVAPRQRYLLDFGWKFFQGNANDPARDLGFGDDQGAFSKEGAFKFAKDDFDVSKWRDLNLPHDWAVELPFVDDKRLEGHGFKPLGRNYPETSVGWYHKSFTLPPGSLGRRITLDFDGAFRNALVFLNGYFVGRNDNGYAPFSFDVTDYLIYLEGAHTDKNPDKSNDGKNTLVVRMDASFGDGWFYEGAGIYRHVWLTSKDSIHLAQWESTVRTEFTGSIAALSLGTQVENTSESPAAVRAVWKILDADGKTVATAESPVKTVPAASTADLSATTKLEHPALWSPDTPHLYTAIVTVETAGRPVDAEPISFGVRTLRFDAEKGFFLNGQPLKIKGTCNHQDHAGVGAALPDRIQDFRLGVLKEMGGNAVRTSHNIPTPEWVDACDRLGMMMMCETRVEAVTTAGLEQFSKMVRRYRNSPSIILWSIGNEEWVLQSNVTGERVARTLIEHAHELDPTRSCTAAVNAPKGGYEVGTAPALDVVGFNYNLDAIEPFHAAHPTRPVVGSETASSFYTRGIYSTDKLRNWDSAYDVNNAPWGETAETWWSFYATHEYTPGGFAWTGFDYRGEPTPYGWPSINSQFGIVDLCGFPKDVFYYYKSWWSGKDVLHLLPHWNWEQRLGEPIDVWVFSNLDSVELFLNGASLGSKQVPALGHLEWKVPYQPGTLEARGTKGGKPVLTERRETTGKFSALRITADRDRIDADGEDVSLLRVEALDAQGRFVPDANELHFNISGAGALLGVGNGDPNCQESDKAPQRSLFNGLAQIIVQSTKVPGEIVVEAYRGDKPDPAKFYAKLTVTTQPAALRPTL